MYEELNERLGKATGPDRELDRMIFAALHPRDVVIIGGNFTSGPDDGIRFNNEPEGYDDPPRYTGSLDAARTLILPGHSLGGLSQISPNDWLMMIFSRTDSRARWEGEAATAELAVCIAGLKARSAQ